MQKKEIFVNNSTVKVPKKYERMLRLLDDEGEMYWAYSQRGYKFESSGCHTENGYTQKEILTGIRTLVECDCKECVENIKGEK